jgi:hypothetical protein
MLFWKQLINLHGPFLIEDFAMTFCKCSQRVEYRRAAVQDSAGNPDLGSSFRGSPDKVRHRSWPEDRVFLLGGKRIPAPGQYKMSRSCIREPHYPFGANCYPGPFRVEADRVRGLAEIFYLGAAY